MKHVKKLLSLLLACCLVLSLLPVYVGAAESSRSVHSGITIDDDPEGGYEGDYVVIYNPSTSEEDASYTGDMSGKIATAVSASVSRSAQKIESYPIDLDAQMEQLATKKGVASPADLPAVKGPDESFQVGDTKTFEIYAPYSPTGDSTVEFKCLYVGEHCYIWTPTSTDPNVYALDAMGETYAATAAAEFDSKFDLMQYSFGNHVGLGDGKLHILYYNIDEGWQPGNGYIAGFFYAYDLYMNNLPMLNIDTYPGVCYPNYYGEGQDWVRLETTFNTMVHEYQHLINFSNTSGMDSWLNECFSAAAEEICYPGSSVVPRIKSWEQFFPQNNSAYLDPPAEFAYQSSYALHNGYSLYDWDTNLPDVLALYAQVSFFAQYLFTRFGNGIYQQISAQFDDDCVEAITAASGLDCSQLARDFRVAVTANATQDQYGGRYGFKVQEGYNPSQYYDVQNPWDLLAPVVFTGSNCWIKGGGAITVKPVGGVYTPPADADSSLVYIGIKLAPAPEYTVSFSVCGSTESSQTVEENDSITLPAAVSAEIEGWTFLGWVENEVSQTTQISGYYLPGASYTVKSDAVFYALFTRTAGDTTYYRTDPVTTHTPVLVPAVPVTCTTDGSSAYYTCSVCGKYFSDESCTTEITLESTVISAPGHSAGDPVTENSVTPSCTGVGGYDTVTYCTVCKAELSRVHTDVPAAGHNPGEAAMENAFAPSCEGFGGYDMVVRCTVCSAILSSEHVELLPAGHAPGDPVEENRVAPTCTEVGGYDTVTYCTVCKAELSREHTEIPALEHDWDEPVYVWTEDNSSVTATRTCKNDESHIETETAQTSAEVTKEATYDEEGEIVYTASFENEAFAAQTKTVATPKLVKPEPVNPFEDVAPGAFYYDAVLWAVNAQPQVTAGTSATTFNPGATCTRGQVVTFLWRACGCPAPASTESPFTDVQAGKFYYQAVLWAVESGVTSGTSATTFSPEKGCTRAQVVTFLWRAVGEPAPTQTDNPFTDVTGGYYYNAVLWAVENKITAGTSATTFAPTKTCTRGQIVTFLYRAMGSQAS